MPSAAATTDSVNSSRDPVLEICHIIQGMTLRPAKSMMRIKATTWSNVSPITYQMTLMSWPGGPLITSAREGISTSASTITKSSMTSQPTAIRPSMETKMPRVSSALSNTTVLAHDKEIPSTSASPGDQPHKLATPMPINVATVICTIAPGMATHFTDIKSLSEKWSPTPNISNITPISDNWAAISTSATKPGVAGPMMMPATR